MKRINEKDMEKDLILAAKYGHLPIVRELIAHSVNVNAKNDNGDTALMMAAKYGHLPFVRELIAHEVDINAKNDNGDTALILTSRGGYSEIIKDLLKSGADPSIENKNGYTALKEIERFVSRNYLSEENIQLLEKYHINIPIGINIRKENKEKTKSF